MTESKGLQDAGAEAGLFIFSAVSRLGRLGRTEEQAKEKGAKERAKKRKVVRVCGWVKTEAESFRFCEL